ncbi:hypothetical protein AYI68_g6328, partial [Smittium mucronatum]
MKIPYLIVAGWIGRSPFAFSRCPGGQVSGQDTAAEYSSSFLFYRFFGPPSTEDGFYLQSGSDPLHGGRLTNIGNQSDHFVDFGPDRLDSGFAHAKGLASV